MREFLKIYKMFGTCISKFEYAFRQNIVTLSQKDIKQRVSYLPT